MRAGVTGTGAGVAGTGAGVAGTGATSGNGISGGGSNGCGLDELELKCGRLVLEESGVVGLAEGLVGMVPTSG